MHELPAGLKALNPYNQFIVYLLTPSKNRHGKTDKIPVDYRSGQSHIDPSDPQFQTDFLQASATATAFGPSYGVGFYFTDADPFWFIDIDNCLIGESKEASPIALQLATVFQGAAIEISSSGTGLHIFGTGTVPDHRCKSPIIDGLEFYNTKRFVALTGDSVIGDAAKDFTNVLPWLVSSYFPATHESGTALEWTTAPCAEWDGIEDDDQLIDRALATASPRALLGNAATFRDLWDGDVEVFARVYPDKYADRAYDASSVDAALAQHLAFWTGKNCERMRTLMLRSKLPREKWETHNTYLETTIKTACARQRDVYARVVNTAQRLSPAVILDGAPTPTLTADMRLLTPQDQKQKFKGCVYVRDEHRVLVPGGDLLKPDQFRASYGGFTYVMDNNNQRTSRNAWEAFTESQAFEPPFAHTTTFKPDLAPGCVTEDEGIKQANIWVPYHCVSKPGDATLFLNHLTKLLPDERDALIFLSYLAALVQHKGVKFQYAPFIQGVAGNGKTLFTRCVAYCIGNRYTHKPIAKEIMEKYNDWMYGRILIGIEDIFVDAESQPEILETLKPMITEERLEIRPMYGTKKMRPLCCNFIINSNHKNGLRKTHDDRRLAPFFTAQQQPGDLARDGLNFAYFKKIYDWLRYDGGYAIVADLLQNYTIPDEFNPAHKQPAPLTSSTKDAIAHGMGGVEQEILEAVDQGQAGFRNGWISSIWLDRLLKNLRADRRIPLNKRRDLLLALGYDWHPALITGRVNNKVEFDGGKPKLFIKQGHEAQQLTSMPDVVSAYVHAQEE